MKVFLICIFDGSDESALRLKVQTKESRSGRQHPISAMFSNLWQQGKHHTKEVKMQLLENRYPNTILGNYPHACQQSKVTGKLLFSRDPRECFSFWVKVGTSCNWGVQPGSDTLCARLWQHSSSSLAPGFTSSSLWTTWEQGFCGVHLAVEQEFVSHKLSFRIRLLGGRIGLRAIIMHKAI